MRMLLDRDLSINLRHLFKIGTREKRRKEQALTRLELRVAKKVRRLLWSRNLTLSISETHYLMAVCSMAAEADRAWLASHQAQFNALMAMLTENARLLEIFDRRTAAETLPAKIRGISVARVA